MGSFRPLDCYASGPGWRYTGVFPGHPRSLQGLRAGRANVAECVRSTQGRIFMGQQAKNIICLWYNRDAEEAARFYAETFPDSTVGAVHRAPGDFPDGKQGDVLTV